MHLLKRLTLPVILAYAAVLHGLIFIFDLLNPAVFLSADRAPMRMESMTGLMNAVGDSKALIGVLTGRGVVGDYLFHTLLYSVLGQYGLILFQLTLHIFTIYVLYHLALLVTRSNIASILAILFFVHLPNFLVYPHSLSSEALYNPLVIISFWFFARYLFVTERWTTLALAGLVLGIATLIRPISVLWPFVVIALMLMFKRISTKNLTHAGLYGAVATIPLLLWMSVMLAFTGHFSMGESGHDVGHCLFKRTWYINQSMSSEQQARVNHDYIKDRDHYEGVLSVPEYLHFGMQYPIPFAKHLVRDFATFTIKSGITKLTLDYFQYDNKDRREFQNRHTGYRRVWEKEGFWASMKFVFTKYPLFALPTLIGLVVFTGFILLTLRGALLVWCRRGELTVAQRLFYTQLALLPPYIFSVSQVVDAMQSRHRAPVEFALCVFAAVGFCFIFDGDNKGK